MKLKLELANIERQQQKEALQIREREAALWKEEQEREAALNEREATLLREQEREQLEARKRDLEKQREHGKQLADSALKYRRQELALETTHHTQRQQVTASLPIDDRVCSILAVSPDSSPDEEHAVTMAEAPGHEERSRVQVPTDTKSLERRRMCNCGMASDRSDHNNKIEVIDHNVVVVNNYNTVYHNYNTVYDNYNTVYDNYNTVYDNNNKVDDNNNTYKHTNNPEESNYQKVLTSYN
ncbi:putative uncharacterized protein DDB_G0271982 [Procambarus clarkii]|uniref:putative uncharacterized protein DDB_G0271982 n=1 Tax=Procambarus clarkii TaxID=6728 RepID=UPI003742B7BD